MIDVDLERAEIWVKAQRHFTARQFAEEFGVLDKVHASTKTCPVNKFILNKLHKYKYKLVKQRLVSSVIRELTDTGDSLEITTDSGQYRLIKSYLKTYGIPFKGDNISLLNREGCERFVFVIQYKDRFGGLHTLMRIITSIYVVVWRADGKGIVEFFDYQKSYNKPLSLIDLRNKKIVRVLKKYLKKKYNLGFLLPLISLALVSSCLLSSSVSLGIPSSSSFSLSNRAKEITKMMYYS